MCQRPRATMYNVGQRGAVKLDVSAELAIDRPPQDVAAFAMDPSNDTEWIGGIREARTLTEPPFAVGTRVERVAVSWAGESST